MPRVPLRSLDTNQRPTEDEFNREAAGQLQSSTKVTSRTKQLSASKNAVKQRASHRDSKAQSAMVASFNQNLAPLFNAWLRNRLSNNNTISVDIHGQIQKIVDSFNTLRLQLKPFRPAGTGRRWHQGSGFFNNLAFAYFDYHRQELRDIPAVGSLITKSWQQHHDNLLQYRNLALRSKQEKSDAAMIKWAQENPEARKYTKVRELETDTDEESDYGAGEVDSAEDSEGDSGLRV